ncbi:SAM-dependent chlorinase/fluorinase [Deltaproteobacteria bacterium PRO3]|nr:SAM-dependent chlorinase/fluorinase [Deltaproteobacteria bacterium PRO3]
MVIALLSDFGLQDHYVGAMKGVLARLAPNAKVIDISHQVPPFDRVLGGLLLYQSYRYFPRKTVFVAVVDPGVGSARKPILAESEDYFFVGPDNGVLAMALAEQKIRRIVHLNNPKYFLQPLSATFHGRDLFAPVAAHLSQGLSVEFFGTELTDYERLPDFVPAFSADRIEGRILAFDRFGNAITNLAKGFVQRHHHGSEWNARVGGLELKGLKSCFSEAAPGEALLYFGSGNLLEIAVNQGSAEEKLGLKRGDSVLIPL